MGRTSTAKSTASATNQKGSAKKAAKTELEKVKKSIEMVVKKGSGDKSNSSSV